VNEPQEQQPTGTPKRTRRVKKRLKKYDIRVWPTWLLVGLAWLIARLPLAIIARLATGLGAIAYAFGRSRRTITLTNLALCFPDMPEADRERLARESFTHTAMGLLESTAVWLNPGRDFASRTTIHHPENLERCRAAGRGVILLGGHFSALDVMGPALKSLDLDVIYRENKNPVWEWLQVRGRSRYFGAVIERSDARSILRRLRAGRIIWYAADQDYGRRHSVFAPFFGIPTASITATAKLAAFNGSPVLFGSNFRDLQTLTWHAYANEPMQGFPSGDDVADATAINQAIEDAILRHPEQYLWMHRRFKTRPEGEPSFYRTPISAGIR
jgi:KDO2-lipid IV(A) lauroyltransferase